MDFIIVQTRKSKRSKPSMTVVPSKWARKDYVYWPPANLSKLSTDPCSEPNTAIWSTQKCKIVGHGQTYESTDELMKKLEAQTDSEDALLYSRGTRANPGKKAPRFKLNQYQLATFKEVSDICMPVNIKFNIHFANFRVIFLLHKHRG